MADESKPKATNVSGNHVAKRSEFFKDHPIFYVPPTLLSCGLLGWVLVQVSVNLSTPWNYILIMVGIILLLTALISCLAILAVLGRGLSQPIAPEDVVTKPSLHKKANREDRGKQ